MQSENFKKIRHFRHQILACPVFLFFCLYSKANENQLTETQFAETKSKEQICAFTSDNLNFDPNEFLIDEGLVTKSVEKAAIVNLKNSKLEINKTYIILNKNEIPLDLENFIMAIQNKTNCYNTFRNHLSNDNHIMVQKLGKNSALIRGQYPFKKNQSIYFLNTDEVKKINSQLKDINPRPLHSIFFEFKNGSVLDTLETSQKTSIITLGYLYQMTYDFYLGPIISKTNLESNTSSSYENQNLILVGGLVEKDFFDFWKKSISIGIHSQFQFDHNFTYNYNLSGFLKINVSLFSLKLSYGRDFLKINNTLHESFTGNLPSVSLFFNYD